jgi:aminomethyltransferase
MAEQKESGRYDTLVCMITRDKGIPRHGYQMLMDGASVGQVTSGTLSPVLRRGICMGYLPLERSKVGNQVQIKVRDTLLQAEIVKPPFVRRDRK